MGWTEDHMKWLHFTLPTITKIESMIVYSAKNKYHRNNIKKSIRVNINHLLQQTTLKKWSFLSIKYPMFGRNLGNPITIHNIILPSINTPPKLMIFSFAKIIHFLMFSDSWPNLEEVIDIIQQYNNSSFQQINVKH